MSQEPSPVKTTSSATSSKKRTKKKKTAAKRRPKCLIGRVEEVSFADWGIEGLKAKIDTGAKTSSLHAENIEHLARNRVSFTIVLADGDREDVTAPIKRITKVRSSSGHLEERIFVETHARIGVVEMTIELSLTGREDLNYRMLLGREALGGTFVVDVGRKFIAARNLRVVAQPADETDV